MKANELRIGNWFIPFMFNGEELEARPIRAMEFLALSQNPHWGKPIPLTEEWLLKFGFTRHHDDYYNDIVFIKNVVNNYEFEWGVYPITLNGGIQINNRKLLKYVHQLQNLYFALTGEELTYGGNK